MADVISFADWAAMQEMIETGQQAVSGMSAAEAQAAMNASANNGLYIYNSSTAAGASNVIEFPGTTAAEAAEAYLEAGGTTSAAGAATASTGAAQETANLILTESATETGTASVAGLLSVNLPTAAAAIAPIAGVALGVGLYELAPDFWTKLSQTLLPFCYEDTELLPVAVDADGNTYYPEEAIEAVKKLIEEEGIGKPSYDIDPSVLNNPTAYNLPLSAGNTSSEFVGQNVHGRYHIKFSISGIVMAAITLTTGTTYLYQFSKTAVSGTYWDWYDGQTPPEEGYSISVAIPITTKSGNIYYFTTHFTQVVLESGVFNNIVNTSELTGMIADLAQIIFEGTESVKYPEGTSQWEGDPYPEDADALNVQTGYDEEGNPTYSPYYPVTTPIGDPGTSADPETSPDPSTNPEVEPAVEPWISPQPNPSTYPETVPQSDPAPVPDPVPETQPVPDPDADPEEDPDPEDTPEDPTEPTDPSDTGDGDTPIIPVIPTLPSAATGLLHVYNPTQSQIDAFGSWLWTTFSGELIETLSKLFNDPMDAVIGLHELYATPAVSGSATIRCGYLDSGIGANLVGSRYTTINCGSVVVEEYYQNYLDYTPYTQCYIYLPFVGIVPVSADDIIGNAVNITYHVDSYTGCVIAVVTVAKKGYSAAVYQFEGNCAVEIPISSGYQSTLMSGLLAVAGTAITENPAVGMAAAHIGRAGLGKNAVQHSGSFGASYGAMGAKIPYIIVRRPTQKKVNNYSESYGYPAHKMVFVGNCTGYLRCREVRVTSTTATNIEKEMIVNALKEGVYIQ